MDFTIIAYSEIWRRYLSVKVRENFPLFYIIPSNLLVDVFRSQSIAVFGNVMVAMSLAVLIAFVFQHQTGKALMNQAQIDYQLYSIDPFAGTLWFAAIAGVWLFCSGIISGYFDNRSNYLNTRMRLRQHPLLKYTMTAKCRVRIMVRLLVIYVSECYWD